MKTVKITIVGVKHIHSKKSNKDFTILNFTYEPSDQSTLGYEVGTLFLEGSDPCALGTVCDGVLGYNRAGNYCVVDIV